jgi:2-(1,2-epoxy-1,2-dihydrophenyl)acetyl-CoA isomerase
MTAVAEGGVRITAEAGVLEITLDRPERKNALTIEDIACIIEALENASTDDTLRVVLIRSTGENFCSGADWVASNTADGVRPRTGSIQRRTPLQAHRLIELLTTLQLPVVCVVKGWAAGLGCQLALAADFTVSAQSSRFWEPFTERGFSPDSGATWLLPRLVGLARAREMLILSRKLTGTEAQEWGLIHRAVPDAEVDAVATELVAQLGAAPTVAVGLTKQALNRGLETGLRQAMAEEANGLELTSRTLDFREGLAAFREGRTAHFEGR